MSGGVDSSVAALLLRRQGFEVQGLSLLIYERRNGEAEPRACCGLQAVRTAQEVARSLAIEHHSVDAREAFMREVMEPFAAQYASGLTPNPCILCNERVKFPLLLQEAQRLGAQWIATGHYARAKDGLLLRAQDEHKDQSYVLYSLPREVLRRLLLPLGGMKKSQVRDLARRHGLPVFDRPESQEICFVGREHYLQMVEAFHPQRPGPIRDLQGRLLGTHKGIAGYTVGQRRGLGVSSPRPLYVLRIDARENTLWVGPREAALCRTLWCHEVRWLKRPALPSRLLAKVRSSMPPQEAWVHPEQEGLRVEFISPQWPPSAGQALVLYDNHTVLGGGRITALRLRYQESPVNAG